MDFFNQTKCLGLNTDQNLNWKINVNNDCSKLRTVCFVFKMSRHTFDFQAIMSIYYAHAY